MSFIRQQTDLRVDEKRIKAKMQNSVVTFSQIFIFISADFELLDLYWSTFHFFHMSHQLIKKCISQSADQHVK